MKISSRHIIKWAEVFGSEAFLYTGSHSNPEEYTNLIVNDQLNPGVGAGSMYGKGVYTVYNLQGTNTSRGVYGNWIYKLRVNLYGFISFNSDITNKIYGQNLTPSEQYKKIYGHNAIIISKLKELEEEYGVDYFNMNFSSTTAREASTFLKGMVKGIIFTGRNDGDVAVIYDPSIITLVSYKDLENNPDGWSRFDQEMIRSTISKSLLGSFRRSKYEETDESVKAYSNRLNYYINNLLNLKDEAPKSAKELKYVGFLVSNNPIAFIKYFFNKEWAQPYIETAIKNLMVNISPEDLKKFLEESDNNILMSTSIKPVIEYFAKNYPNEFIFNSNFRKKEIYKEFIQLAIENLAQKDPKLFIERFVEDNFIANFFNSNLYKPYISIAFKNLFDTDPSSALYYSRDNNPISKEWVKEPWAKEYIIAGAEEELKKDPTKIFQYLGESWAKEDWFKKYVVEAVKKASEENSYTILYYLNDIHGKYLLEEEWMKPYLSMAAEQSAYYEPAILIESFSDYDWAKPYLDLAFKTYKRHLMESYSSIEIVRFLKNHGSEENLKPYINTIIQILAERNPTAILSYLKNVECVNIPVESLGGKTWFEYAEELTNKSNLGQVAASRRFKNKIIKLAKFIGNLGLEEYSSKLLYLAKNASSDESTANKTHITEEQNAALKELYVIISKTYEDLKKWAEEKGYDTSSNSFRIKIKNEYNPPFNLTKKGWNLILNTAKYKEVFPQLADELSIIFKPDVDGNAELAVLGGIVSYIAISSTNFSDSLGIKTSIQHELQHIISFGTTKEDGIEGTINYLTNDGEIRAHAKEAAYYFHKMFPDEKLFDFEKIKEEKNSFKNYYNFINSPEEIAERRGLDSSYVDKMRIAGESFKIYSEYFFSLFKKTK